MNATAVHASAGAARRFHALSDETRLEILRLLSTGERCVCDLTEALAAAQSRLSFHLKVLRQAGVVRARREGRWVYYAIDPTALDAMAAALREIRPGETTARSIRCCATGGKSAALGGAS